MQMHAGPFEYTNVCVALVTDTHSGPQDILVSLSLLCKAKTHKAWVTAWHYSRLYLRPSPICSQIRFSNHTSVLDLGTITPQTPVWPCLWNHLVDINESTPSKQRFPADTTKKSSPNIHLLSASMISERSAARIDGLSTKAIKMQPLPSPHCAASPVWRAYQRLPDLEEIWPAPPKPRRSRRRGANERCSWLASLQLHL